MVALVFRDILDKPFVKYYNQEDQIDKTSAYVGS